MALLHPVTAPFSADSDHQILYASLCQCLHMHPASVMAHPAIPEIHQLTVRLADLVVTSLTEHYVVLCYLQF